MRSVERKGDAETGEEDRQGRGREAYHVSAGPSFIAHGRAGPFSE